MDPRTSHIGFRSQGMSGGGYVDVPGLPSANDNLIATIPVASGERIYVDPMSVKRGNAGTTINISAPMMFSGMSIAMMSAARCTSRCRSPRARLRRRNDDNSGLSLAGVDRAGKPVRADVQERHPGSH